MMSDIPGAETSQFRVAVVDDEADIGDIIRRGLKGDYETDLFTDADQVLEALRGGDRYDVILCDLHMPGVSGREIYDEIEDRWPDQAESVVFMSGAGPRGARRDILQGLDNRLLEKPFRLSELRAMVAEVAQRP